MSEERLETKDGVLAGFVRYAFEARPVDGYLAIPDDGRPHPGVVLIQEWWGVEPHIKQLVERLAREGFVVLAPDLYHGQVAEKPDDARKAMMAIDFGHAVTEIDAAIDFLRGRPDVEPKRIGVTGFCMGGLLTWRTAEAHSDKLACAAPFYGGRYEPTADDVRKIDVPILAVWGEHDASIPAEQREHIVGLLKAEGKPHEALVYDAGHGFMNDTHGHYDAPSAAAAWAKLVTFLRANTAG